MNGTQKKEDPAEICISGTLYKIEAEISKGDYSVLMALITENFSEKGSFEVFKVSNLCQIFARLLSLFNLHISV